MLQTGTPILRALAVVLTLTFALVGRAPAKEAPPAPETMIPQDAFWAVVVPDRASLEESLKESKFGELYQSPEFAGIRSFVDEALAKARENIREDFDVDAAEILEQLDGSIAIFQTHFRTWTEGQMEYSSFDICMIAEVPEGDREQAEEIVRQLLDKLPEDADKSSEEFRGERLYRVEYTQREMAEIAQPGMSDMQLEEEITTIIEYAFVGDYLVLTEGPEDPLKKILNVMKGEGDSLAAHDGFRTLRAQTADRPGVLGYVDFARLIEKSFPQAQGETMNQLGLAGAGPVLFSMQMVPEALETTMLMKMPREKKGLVSMMYAGTQNRVQTAELVPAGVYGYSSWTLDGQTLFAALRETLAATMPWANGALQQYLSMIQQQFGIDVENQLLANIKGEHFYYSQEAIGAQTGPAAQNGEPAAPTQNYFLALQNGQAVVDTLNQLFTTLAGEQWNQPLVQDEQSGFSIWTLREDMADARGLRFALGLTPRYLVIGDSLTDVRAALRNIAEPPASNLAQDEGFRRTLEQVERENLRFFAYTSPEMAEELTRSLRETIDMTGIGEDPGFQIESQDIPGPEVWKRYLGPSMQTLHVGPEIMRSDYIWKTVE